MTITDEPTGRQALGIRETVSNTLASEGRGDYLGYATGVIEALQERDYRIREQVVVTARNYGLDRETAEVIASDLGLEKRPEPAPAPETPSTPDEGDLMATLRQVGEDVKQLAGTVNSLLTFARANGYRG